MRVLLLLMLVAFVTACTSDRHYQHMVDFEPPTIIEHSEIYYFTLDENSQTLPRDAMDSVLKKFSINHANFTLSYKPEHEVYSQQFIAAYSSFGLDKNWLSVITDEQLDATLAITITHWSPSIPQCEPMRLGTNIVQLGCITKANLAQQLLRPGNIMTKE